MHVVKGLYLRLSGIAFEFSFMDTLYNILYHMLSGRYCTSLSSILGFVTPVKWHKIEIRLKLNDMGESNGEFVFVFNDETTIHSTSKK